MRVDYGETDLCGLVYSTHCLPYFRVYLMFRSNARSILIEAFRCNGDSYTPLGGTLLSFAALPCFVQHLPLGIHWTYPSKLCTQRATSYPYFR